MADQIQWLDGQAKVLGIVEKICPKRHIRQNKWLEEWNEMYLNNWSRHCYDYISDYECIFDHPFERFRYFWPGPLETLRGAKQRGTHISIANLVHFTSLEFSTGIITSGGFRGGYKKYNEDATGHDVKAKFSWWSPMFGEHEKELVRNTLGKAIQPFHDKFRRNQSHSEVDGGIGDQFHEDGSDQDEEKDSDHGSMKEGSEENDSEDNDGNLDDDQDDVRTFARLQKQFATSKAFNPTAQRYGQVYFQYDINDLCDYYGVHFDCGVQFKILGTFSYKKEVMHSVLICSQENGDNVFEEYPPVLTPEDDVNNEAVVTRDRENGNWVWKPQATGTEIKRLPTQRVYPKFRRWEKVAFAFHIPDEWEHDDPEEALMYVPDLHKHLQYL